MWFSYSGHPESVCSSTSTNNLLTGSEKVARLKSMMQVFECFLNGCTSSFNDSLNQYQQTVEMRIWNNVPWWSTVMNHLISGCFTRLLKNCIMKSYTSCSKSHVMMWRCSPHKRSELMLTDALSNHNLRLKLVIKTSRACADGVCEIPAVQEILTQPGRNPLCK